MRSKKLLIAILLGVVVVLGTGMWLSWTPLRTGYLLRGLRAADENSRAAWADSLARLTDPPIDGLIMGLSEEEGVSENCAFGLDALVKTWNDEDRTVTLSDLLTANYSKMSSTGQARTLLLLVGWLGQTEKEKLRACGAKLVCEATNAHDETLEPALSLALLVVGHACTEDALAGARHLAQAGLISSMPTARARAVSLCMQAGVDQLGSVVPLLRDPSAEVRRAVVAALGPADQIINEDSLLACLHDSDEQVCKLAHNALLGRGLRPEQIELGRLLTHTKSQTRLQVLDKLPDVPDLDPGVWLRRLSQDGSPAVRAAALRAIHQAQLDLYDRVEQMARTDPSPTVAQLARYYLVNRPRATRPVGGP